MGDRIRREYPQAKCGGGAKWQEPGKGDVIPVARIDKRLETLKLNPAQLEAMTEYASKQADIVALFLYGSYGKEQQTPLSDIDLAVLPFLNLQLTLDRELEILSELQGIGESDDINLVNLQKVPVTLQMRVLESGHLLYCRDHIALADFKEYVIRRYCDFAPDLQAIYRDYDASLREEYL